jgi:hypothetical protein
MHYLRIFVATAALTAAAAGTPVAMAASPQVQSSPLHLVRAGGGSEGFHGGMGGYHGGGFHAGGFHGGYAMHGYHPHGYGYLAPYPYCPYGFSSYPYCTFLG